MQELSNNLMTIYNCVLQAVTPSCKMEVDSQYQNYLLGLCKLHKSKAHSATAWNHQ